MPPNDTPGLLDATQAARRPGGVFLAVIEPDNPLSFLDNVPTAGELFQQVTQLDQGTRAALLLALSAAAARDLAR